ncbi:MAG TPA: 16S rRNA (cytidine(1402)-2'-O)-methyltransferase [Dehalococcoidia bacterium]|nr:16S rRNA (cytidine(1402)-2'-O)-methyltransferase [Dehalococcoidia bacterium]
MPTLYVIATPIGNLEDISLRALRVLREVKLIAAEDTRKTKRLLSRYDINTQMTSYFEHNKMVKLDYLLDYLQKDDLALVSEAGMPGISDPGYELIATAGQRGIEIVPVPGPSAVTTALAVSGLPTDRFLYIGFLPHKSGERKRALDSVINETGTIIALETPHRLPAALDDILAVLGDRRIAICRELTKLHEETFRGTISEAIKYFVNPRGEFTLVIEGKDKKEKPVLTKNTEKQLHELYLSGVKAREAIAMVSEETGLSKKELYQAWLKLDKVWERERGSCNNAERRK